MSNTKLRSKDHYTYLFFLIGILLIGAYFRFYGTDWDKNFHLHPDERFLTMVITSISPVQSVQEYFNTSLSSLNPHNILDNSGNSVFPFFVYGTFPIFLVRYIAEWIGSTGYNEVHIVGRTLSGVFDIGTILIVFLIARYFFKNKWQTLLASAIYAFAVLPIQISHFFIVDNFATFFSALAILFAVKIYFKDKANEPWRNCESSKEIKETSFRGCKDYLNYALFGIAVGLAAASKINTLVVSILLPAAIVLRGDLEFSADKLKPRIYRIIFSGLITIILFRIFQPYAFLGSDFLGLTPNPRWINNLKELSFISSGNSNYPPSIQWARRSFWFPIYNLVVWGMGLIPGFFAVSGIIFLGIKFFKGQYKNFLLLWLFAVLYIIWQALRWNPTMRYFLIIYPILSIVASWFFGQVVDYANTKLKTKGYHVFVNIIAVVIIILIILGAASFQNIYRQPMTRIAASEWIYENIPGAINLSLADSDGEFIQPINYPRKTLLEADDSIEFQFSPLLNGEISEIYFDHILNLSETIDVSILSIELLYDETDEILLSESLAGKFSKSTDSKGEAYQLIFKNPVAVEKSKDYQFRLTISGSENTIQFSGNIYIQLNSNGIKYQQPIFEFSSLLKEDREFTAIFTPYRDCHIHGVDFFRWNSISSDTPTQITIAIKDENSGLILTDQKFLIKTEESIDYRGYPVSIEFNDPIALIYGKNYSINIRILDEGSRIIINGSKIVKETDWDDMLPLYMYGFNPYDSYYGIYTSDLNFQIYWDDDQSKLTRFLDGLYQADYFITTSNRQWGSVTQIHERYPLTTYFYRQLIGCTVDNVQWCYRVAYPGIFQGNLGFELKKTFQVNPSILGIEFNSQFAEEAFTVYDHPKVMIFEKSRTYDFEEIYSQLATIDLSQVLNISIKEAENRPGLLLLNLSQNLKQKINGTWSDLFNYKNLVNSNQLFSVVVWYLFILFLGWIFYPIVRISFSGLNDKGYPLSKLVGLIIWSFFTWVGGSNGIDLKRSYLLLSLLFASIINLIIYLKQKKEINREIKENKKYFVIIELISIIFFLIFLAIRLGNPDLWHPFKGGEKPMDFAYLNAIIKSVHFPPYDPWYAGGYINYYYFGFILVGLIIKLLGIIPSIAYNLILPTFFSFTALAAFSIGWNLSYKKMGESKLDRKMKLNNPYFQGLVTSAFVLIIGNLGTINMMIQGIINLGIANHPSYGFWIFDKIGYFFRGLGLLLKGAGFNYYPGDWYWIPSRTIPGTVITEFPFFTFLYADPHAHMYAYPITLLVLGWSLSVIKSKQDKNFLFRFWAQFATGALIVGILRPTNTWDYPVFLTIACLSLAYALIHNDMTPERFLPGVKTYIRKYGYLFLIIILFITLSIVFFAPYNRWYGQAYSSIEIWKGDRTPLWAYFLHWGFFLFVIFSWIFYKIYIWAKNSPLSSLEPYYRKRKLIWLILLLATVFIIGFQVYGLRSFVISFPLLIILITFFIIIGKKSSVEKRFALLLIIIGITLTMMVELIALKGDIGRMNTVFKFYLQAWTCISIGAAYFLFEISKGLEKLEVPSVKIWKTIFCLMLISVTLFPFIASMDKITDRINENTPVTLDGMQFMKYSTYSENNYLMNLSQDYYAIRWMQENITGTPVIVEANIPEYRWGSRFSIYTGLPGIIGWNWHQRQQRAINPDDWVFKRVADVTEFYSTNDVEEVKKIITLYDVEYIVVGQLEKAVYPETGLRKFIEFSGVLWEVAYESADTIIYHVENNDL